MKVHYPKLYNMAHLLALNVLLLPKDLTINKNLKIKLTLGVHLSLAWGNIHIIMTIIVKLVYWCISQISGEHLQDHMSSGLLKT